MYCIFSFLIEKSNNNLNTCYLEHFWKIRGYNIYSFRWYLIIDVSIGKGTLERALQHTSCSLLSKIYGKGSYCGCYTVHNSIK